MAKRKRFVVVAVGKRFVVEPVFGDVQKLPRDATMAEAIEAGRHAHACTGGPVLVWRQYGFPLFESRLITRIGFRHP